MRKWLGYLGDSVKRWWDMDPFREGAVIGYYAIFALPGLLVVIISVAGFYSNARYGEAPPTDMAKKRPDRQK